MNATSGTNAAIWMNFLVAAAGAIFGVVDPAMLAAVLTPKFAGFAIPIYGALNWLLHSFTGNSVTAILPNPVISTVVNTGNPETAR